MTVTRSVTPPRSWIDPATHYLKALDSEWYRALVVLQNTVVRSTVEFWHARGATCAHLPITTGSVSSPMGLGSDSLPVPVELFGTKTYLADSMQFGLEYLCRLSPTGQAYYLMPAFRGEQVDATHLCQYYHSEAEIPGGLDAVVDVAERYVRHLVTALAEEHHDLLGRLTGDTLDHVHRLLDRTTAFANLTFDQASDDLDADDRYVETHPDGWRTLTRAGEQELMARHGEFLWVTHWDRLSVPFYQAYDASADRVRNGDLLFGPGEVIGAGERHTTGEQVREALLTHGVPEEGYAWYVSMKDVAPLHTAGFGMGTERFLMWLIGHDDIRDFQIFVRENGRDIVP